MCYINVKYIGLSVLLTYEVSGEMKTIFSQNLTGGILNGLLKNRLNGLFTRTPTVAVLLLAAVIAACASSDDSKPSNPTTPPTPADCTFAEDVGGAIGGTEGCKFLALPQNLNSTTYDITVGEVLAGQEVNTTKLGLGNFTFIEIINGSASDSQLEVATPLTFSADATALNITISDIADDVFGEFYIDLVKSDDASVKVRYTISITPVNDAPIFSAVVGSGEFTAANVTTATLARYSFAGIPFNSTAGSSVGNVSARDDDNDEITYSIIGEMEDTNLFQIDQGTGEITLKIPALISARYQFNVNAIDGQGGNTAATISVTVGDPSPPVFSSTPYNFNLSLSEANVAGVVVGNVSAVDAEGTPFIYNLLRSGDLFELADSNNTDGSRNIFLSRPATISDIVRFPVTFQVVATHQEGGSSSMAEVTVTLINDLSSDDDSDRDGIVDFYDADPNDAAVNVDGDGEPGDPYIISNIYQLQAIAGVDHTGTALNLSIFTNYTFLYGTDAADQLTKHYELAGDINASTTNTAVWNKPAVTDYIGRGWTPIAGKSGQSFSGSFNGDGYAISNLNISLRAASATDAFGLFGTNSGNISAVGLKNIEMRIQSVEDVLLFYGSVNPRTIPNAGNGGLVGKNEQAGIIQYTYVSGLVNATADKVGALVGSNLGEISYSYSTAAVEGRLDTGGLVGSNTAGGRVSSSYATGSVIGAHGYRDAVTNGNDPYEAVVGSLVGYVSGDTNNIVNASYATGSAIAEVYDIPNINNQKRYIGNLVGQLDTGAMLTSSYWYNNPDITDITAIGNVDDSTVEGHTGLNNAQLQGCELDGAIISDVTSNPTCANLFPTDDWGNTTITTTDGDIEHGWIFNAGEYPSLSAVRSPGDKPLLPSGAEQECQRNGMPLGCE